MRRRMIVGLMGVLAASSLVIGSSMSIAGAQTDPPKAAKCAGDTKKKAIKQVKLAYTHFLDGAKYPDAKTDKEPYIQFLSGSEVSPAFQAQFEASSAANAVRPRRRRWRSTRSSAPARRVPTSTSTW